MVSSQSFICGVRSTRRKRFLLLDRRLVWRACRNRERRAGSLYTVFGQRRRTAMHCPANTHAILALQRYFVYGQALLLRRRNPALLDNMQARKGYLGLVFCAWRALACRRWLAGGHLVYELGVGVR